MIQVLAQWTINHHKKLKALKSENYGNIKNISLVINSLEWSRRVGRVSNQCSTYPFHASNNIERECVRVKVAVDKGDVKSSITLAPSNKVSITLTLDDPPS